MSPYWQDGPRESPISSLRRLALAAEETPEIGDWRLRRRLDSQRRAALAAEAVAGRRLRATVVTEDGRGIDPVFIRGLSPGPSMTRPRRTVVRTGAQEVNHSGGDQTHAGDQQDPREQPADVELGS